MHEPSISPKIHQPSTTNFQTKLATNNPSTVNQPSNQDTLPVHASPAMTLPLAEIISEISIIQNTNIKIVSGPFKGGSNVVYEIQCVRGGEVVGVPYTVMEYLDRAALESWNTQVLPKERR